jgi:spore coat protein U-like protein
MRIARVTVILFSLFLAVAVSAAAQTARTSDSGSITLTGNVAKRVAVEVTPIGDYNTLDLMQDVSDLQVASVNEFSNVKAGYTVTLESSTASGGSLSAPVFAGGAGDDSLEYSIAYADSPVSFDGGQPAVITDAADKTALVGVDKDLTISYSGTSVNIYEGTYSDTLTFTIEAK